MTQVPKSPHQTAQEQSLQLACGPQEQLHMEVTVRWFRQPTGTDVGNPIHGGDPGPPQEKQPGGNSLRASHLPPLEATADAATVQRQRMTIVCGPDETVQLNQWLDVTRAADHTGGTVRSQGTDPGNQGSKQGGGNSLRAR